MSTGGKRDDSVKQQESSEVILEEELSIVSSRNDELPISNSSKSSASDSETKTCSRCLAPLGENHWADVPDEGDLCSICHKEWSEYAGYRIFGI
jgi:hypothetical protein